MKYRLLFHNPIWISLAFEFSSPVLVFNSKNSGVSGCHGSKYKAKAPFLLPAWSTYFAISLKTLHKGIIPLDLPFDPAI